MRVCPVNNATFEKKKKKGRKKEGIEGGRKEGRKE